MTPTFWSRISKLFHDLSELAEEEQAARLRALAKIAAIATGAGSSEQARAYSETLLATADRLLAERPDDEDAMAAAAAHHRMGAAQPGPGEAGGAAHLATAVALCRRLLALRPDDTEQRAALAGALRVHGAVPRTEGDVAGTVPALASVREAVTLQEAILAANSGSCWLASSCSSP